MMVECCASVGDSGPTLGQHCLNVLCLLEWAKSDDIVLKKTLPPLSDRPQTVTKQTLFLIIDLILNTKLTFFSPSYFSPIFIHLKLCLATATHNFKWVKITHICLVREDCFTLLSAQSWQYRNWREPELGLCPTLIESLQGFFIHRTIGSTVHSIPLNTTVASNEWRIL